MGEFGQKKKTIKQALAEGEGSVTLWFGEFLRFKIEDEWNKTNVQGKWDFNLDSYFVTNTLGFSTQDVAVEDVCVKAKEYIRNEQKRLAYYKSAPREYRASKRPWGLIVLTLISLVWPIFGLLTSYSALQIMTRPMFNIMVINVTNVLGIRAVLMYGIAILCVGFLQVIVNVCLLRGKVFAYKFGLGIPLTLLIINVVYGVLSLSAAAGTPHYMAQVSPGLFFGWFFGSGIVWVSTYWYFLRKPSVKELLGVYI